MLSLPKTNFVSAITNGISSLLETRQPQSAVRNAECIDDLCLAHSMSQVRTWNFRGAANLPLRVTRLCNEGPAVLKLLILHTHNVIVPNAIILA